MTHTHCTHGLNMVGYLELNSRANTILHVRIDIQITIHTHQKSVINTQNILVHIYIHNTHMMYGSIRVIHTRKIISRTHRYGVATISRIDQIIGLFCRM